MSPLAARALGLLAFAALAGCASSPKPAPLARPPAAPAALPLPRGASSWLPTARHSDLAPIEGVPLISLDGAAVTVDGLRVGDLESSGRVSRVSALFVALRARREAWLGVHAGEPWPGVVAYRFPPDTPAFAVKSVVLTAGYAACPNGSLLVEVRGEGRRRVGRLPVDPLMVSEPDAQVLTVEVKREAVVVAWKAPGAAGHLRVLPRAAGSEVLEEADLAALESEVDAVWSSRGAHRSPADPSFDQVVLHVEDALPYRSFIAVIDALHGPQRSLLVGRREERVPALNVNLAPD